MNAPESATDWPRVWLLVAAGVAASFQVGKVPPALPAVRADLGMGLVAAGWVLSLFNLLGVVAGSMIGALASGWGERRAVLAGLAVVAAASAAGAAAPGAAWLLATRFIEGAGFLVVVIALPALIARAAAPADLKLAFGLWGAYMPVGTATMILLAPWFIAGLGGWRGLWLANAVLVAAMAAVLAVATAGTPLARRVTAARATAAGLLSDLHRTVTAAGPILLAVAFGAYTLQYLALTGFLPTIYGEGGFTPAAAAQLTALVVILNAFGNMLGGALLHRGLPRWALIAVASGFMALSTIVTYANVAFVWRYAACLAFSLVGGLLPTSVLGGTAALTPERRLVPIVNGLVVQGSNIGQVLGPPAVAALAAATGGWRLSPLVFLAAGAVGVAAALRLRRVEHAVGS
jgi:MFS family permease